MLDVHPPHAPTHTWKDFFIHVGTICVGLLIAVGLEQTVEYFHHLHQRHELEAELRSESETNKRNLEINIPAYDALLKWELAVRKDIDTTLATHGKANLPPPACSPIRLTPRASRVRESWLSTRLPTTRPCPTGASRCCRKM